MGGREFKLLTSKFVREYLRRPVYYSSQQLFQS